MSANSSIILTNLDFDTIKNTFKSYLREQDRFNDYDFEGSNINVLLDILSYNTFHNSFYLNMVGNEMFLDSAQLRSSVVSHAKELNYVPQSFRSATANVNIVVKSSNLTNRSLILTKGTTFTSRSLDKNYTFTVSENIVIDQFTIDNTNQITFTGNNITLYEGYYVNDTFTYTYNNPRRIVISNKNVDISSISVTVLEDSGATTQVYNRANSLFDLNELSKVFFVQGSETDSYEIVFGDGVTGRRPKNNSIISVEYRVCNGELPNGCSSFSADSPIQGESAITVFTNEAAGGGTVYEDMESIKYNAPRHFATQERAITTEDYETLLKINFPEVNTVTAYGGEDLTPPQFGKVFVAVDLKDVDGLPDIKKNQYYKFLKPRSPVSIDPVFVNPEYLYLEVVSNVKYNVNVTRLGENDIKTIVTSAIVDYAQTNLNDFNRTFRYSKLVQAIDNSQSAIVSNETDIRMIKLYNPNTGVFNTFDINFGSPLSIVYSSDTPYSVTSSIIIYRGQRCIIRDDGNGILKIYSYTSNQELIGVGTINYDTGLLQFSNIRIDSYVGSSIKFYATPKNKDIFTVNNVISNIIDSDISITVEAIRV